MAGPELTPELLAQLEKDAAALRQHGDIHSRQRTGGTCAEHTVVAGETPICDARGMNIDIVLRALGAIPALVAAAKERGQLREAARLREHATLDAWSGSLVGLDAAGAASARAEALDALAGIDTPTAEQQRDAALSKLGAVLLEKRQLCAEVERLRNLGRNACILARSGTGRDRAKEILAEIERKP